MGCTFARAGFGADDGEEEHCDDDDALPLMQAASAQGRSAVAGGRRARRTQVHRRRAYALPPRCAAWGGYTLHGGVAVGGRNTGGRDWLCRYLARPALAPGRMEETPAGLIRVTFKRPWADGTAGVTFTPLELVERLAALVPPPRAHLVHYHGVLAGRSAWRQEVVPTPPASIPAHWLFLWTRATPRWIARYLTWAELLWRVFAVSHLRRSDDPARGSVAARHPTHPRWTQCRCGTSTARQPRHLRLSRSTSLLVRSFATRGGPVPYSEGHGAPRRCPHRAESAPAIDSRPSLGKSAARGTEPRALESPIRLRHDHSPVPHVLAGIR